MVQIQNPLVGGEVRHYDTDSGCDIYPSNGQSGQVICPVDGTILYSEGLLPGDDVHTSWATPPDTPGCVLVALDKAICVGGQVYGYMWFCHMKTLVYHVRDGIDSGEHIKAGTYLGHSGSGNKVPHLHFGLLIRRAQQPGDYIEPSELAKLITNKITPTAQPVSTWEEKEMAWLKAKVKFSEEHAPGEPFTAAETASILHRLFPDPAKQTKSTGGQSNMNVMEIVSRAAQAVAKAEEQPNLTGAEKKSFALEQIPGLLENKQMLAHIVEALVCVGNVLKNIIAKNWLAAGATAWGMIAIVNDIIKIAKGQAPVTP